jgi:ADP-ribosyl-[dinitrogen reductase] hydrolase
MNLQKRYRGALLAMAAGDATGTTLEFCPPNTFTPITDMVGGGPFNLKRGQWTDDTSMALCLGHSLVICAGFDAADQMRRYCNWYRNGYMSSTGVCFDIGNTVRAALHLFESSGEPFAGSTDPNTAGNGSLMRLVVVPLAYALDPVRAIEMSALSSRTTHGAPVAVDACRYFAALLIGALLGETKQTLLADHYSPVPGYWQSHPLVPEIDAIAGGSFRNQPPFIKGTGYAAKSLEAALWAFANSDSFKDGCLLAANLGDDADTTAAIFGQLAGAFYGVDGIPQSWLECLVQRDSIEKLADDLQSLSLTI